MKRFGALFILFLLSSGTSWAEANSGAGLWELYLLTGVLAGLACLVLPPVLAARHFLRRLALDKANFWIVLVAASVVGAYAEVATFSWFCEKQKSALSPPEQPRLCLLSILVSIILSRLVCFLACLAGWNNPKRGFVRGDVVVVTTALALAVFSLLQ